MKLEIEAPTKEDAGATARIVADALAPLATVEELEAARARLRLVKIRQVRDSVREEAHNGG